MSEKNKNKLITKEQYILKIMKILRTASLRSNFTGSYTKKSGKHISIFTFNHF